MTITTLRALIAKARPKEAPVFSLLPTVTLDGIRIVVGKVIPKGVVLPLDINAFAISEADYEEARAGDVAPTTFEAVVGKLPTTCLLGYVWDAERGEHVRCELPYGHGGDCALLPADQARVSRRG